MKKEELRMVMQKAATKEADARELLNVKINEFMHAQEKLKKEFRQMLKDYFPKDIENLIKEYTEIEQRYFTCGNIWIKDPGIKFRIMWDPNKIEGCEILKDAPLHGDVLTMTPTSLSQLENAYKKYQNMKMLKTILEADIEKIYAFLADWKEKQLNKQFDALNAIVFDNEEKQTERYRVTIIVEKISDNTALLEEVMKFFKDRKISWGTDEYAEFIAEKECIECSCDLIKERNFRIYVPYNLFDDIQINGIGKVEEYLAEEITERIASGVLHLI